MKLSAQAQTTIDIIDEILTKKDIPADRIVSHYFRRKRFIGSHDRKNITEKLYSILRYFPFLEKEIKKNINGRNLYFCYLCFFEHYLIDEIHNIFNNELYSPHCLNENEINAIKKFHPPNYSLEKEAFLPNWILPYVTNEHTNIFSAMNESAPFDLRVNTLISNREQVMNDFWKKGILTKPTPWSPYGIRMKKRSPILSDSLFKNGMIEVQDEGSQLVSILCDAMPGMFVLDMCAGAGGKSLAMACTMKNKGTIVSTDIAQSRLNQCKKRLKRAKVHNVQTRLINDSWLKRQKNRFDRVVIDAPCSGTGTWRRNPDLKIRGNNQMLIELINKQKKLFVSAAPVVKKGGRLVYITCSLLADENQKQVEWFLNNHKNFSIIPITSIWHSKLHIPCPTEEKTLQLDPKNHYTDGFFISIFQRNF